MGLRRRVAQLMLTNACGECLVREVPLYNHTRTTIYIVSSVSFVALCFEVRGQYEDAVRLNQGNRPTRKGVGT